MHTQSAADFVPANRIARWTKWLLIAVLLLSLRAMLSDFVLLALVSQPRGPRVTQSDLSTLARSQDLVGALQFWVHFPTVIAFLAWFHRVHSNLPALGARHLKYTSTWAVAGFFVPVLNLVRPAQVMREVWEGSEPTAMAGDTKLGVFNRSPIAMYAAIGSWWALFVALGILMGVVNHEASYLGNATPIELMPLAWLVLFADVVNLLAAGVTAWLVGHITDWQAQRATRP